MPVDHDDSSDPMQQAIRFMEAANSASDMNGACVLETFTCSSCKAKQRSVHAFSETLKCSQCGHSNKSRVPRLPQEGEITADALMQALFMVRKALPDVPASTEEWCKRQEGAIRTVAYTLAACEARRALNLVQDFARQLSGGHRA